MTQRDKNDIPRGANGRSTEDDPDDLLYYPGCRYPDHPRFTGSLENLYRTFCDMANALINGGMNRTNACLTLFWLLDKEVLNHQGISIEAVDLRTCAYELYLKTNHCREVRDEVKELYGNRCAVCNRSGLLDIHHRTYEHRGDERKGDLILLCRECHRIFHEHGRLAGPSPKGKHP